MCRKGRMFAPTKTWRKWHRKINTNQKRYAVASAVAASALPSLVMARGHKVDQVPEFPLVVSNTTEAITKTKDAVKLLKSVGAYADVEKSKNSKQVRTGIGKIRNRRYVQRRGPLVVYANDNGIVKAFRNLPGVDVAHVDRLNLLQLAPGGHLGRFIVWTEAALKRANEVFGSTTRASVTKAGYKLPRNIMSNSDLTRIINSDEVQQTLRATLPGNTRRHARQKKNPIKNFNLMARLNPYASVQRRARQIAAKSKSAKKNSAAAKAHYATKKANYARISA
jgi:large subunit ribosomal protein L4e